MLKNAKEEKTAQEKKMIQYYPLNFYHYLCWFSSAIINQHLRCIIMKGNTNYIKESLKKKKTHHHLSTHVKQNIQFQSEQRAWPRTNSASSKSIRVQKDFFQAFFFFLELLNLLSKI